MAAYKIIMLLLAVGAAATVQPSLAASAERSVAAPWKVAGVALGMSPREVELAMQAAGYSRAGRSTSRSWQGEVASQARVLRGVIVPEGPEAVKYEDFKTGQERISIEYAPSRAGPRVAKAKYQISVTGIDADTFRSAIMSRYGAPTRKWEVELHYCSAGETHCDTPFPFYNPQLPNLTVFLTDGMRRSIDLWEGRKARDARELAIRAEVDRLYPKKDKPTF
ncbi:MAG: hypothetical protein WBR13_02245 [Allosphingosinicella sp.]